MSKERLEELTKLADEMHLIKGVNINSMGETFEEAVKHSGYKEEQKFIYYYLRNITNIKSYASVLNAYSNIILEGRYRELPKIK